MSTNPPPSTTMSTNPPPSMTSTEVEAPQFSTRSVLTTTGSSTPHVDFASRRPRLPLRADYSTTMLMRWVYDTRGVTVNEKLYRDVAQQMGKSDDGK